MKDAKQINVNKEDQEEEEREVEKEIEKEKKQKKEQDSDDEEMKEEEKEKMKRTIKKITEDPKWNKKNKETKEQRKDRIEKVLKEINDNPKWMTNKEKIKQIIKLRKEKKRLMVMTMIAENNIKKEKKNKEKNNETEEIKQIDEKINILCEKNKERRYEEKKDYAKEVEKEYKNEINDYNEAIKEYRNNMLEKYKLLYNMHLFEKDKNEFHLQCNNYTEDIELKDFEIENMEYDENIKKSKKYKKTLRSSIIEKMENIVEYSSNGKKNEDYDEYWTEYTKKRDIKEIKELKTEKEKITGKKDIILENKIQIYNYHYEFNKKESEIKLLKKQIKNMIIYERRIDKYKLIEPVDI